jgi:hypothetical protein
MRGPGSTPAPFLPLPTKCLRDLFIDSSHTRGHAPEDYALHLTHTIRSRSRHELRALDVPTFGKLIADGKREFVDRLAEAKATRADPEAANIPSDGHRDRDPPECADKGETPTDAFGPRRWACRLLNGIGVPPTGPRIETVLERLAAAREFDQSIWRGSVDGSYRFDTKLSNWLDLQQLYYLGSGAKMLVHDGALYERVRHCSQKAQVLPLKDYI